MIIVDDGNNCGNNCGNNLSDPTPLMMTLEIYKKNF